MAIMLAAFSVALGIAASIISIQLVYFNPEFNALLFLGAINLFGFITGLAVCNLIGSMKSIT